MKTAEQAFAEISAILDFVEKEAGDTLKAFCHKRFFLASRKKDAVSLRDKLETGRFSSLADIDDLVAFSVVIDTKAQEPEVRKFIKKAFDVLVTKRQKTLQDERVFDFDCTRMYCRLRTHGISTEIQTVVFEIQIRTLLQHAWSKITHPLVYKARIFDPKMSRLASELMAQIEAADRTFSRFKTVSKSVKNVGRPNELAGNIYIHMIDALVDNGTIPSELRPANGRRLGQNIHAAVDRRKAKPGQACEVVRNFLTQQRSNFPLSVSIYQHALIALHEKDYLRKDKHRFYITAELVSLFPTASSIPNTVKL